MADAQGQPAGEVADAWRRRVVAPVRAQLRQGLSVERASLALAFGLALGICPVLGTTTVLCALAGVWLRLNQPLIQLVNYLAYPAQLALLIPFVRAGERLFGAPPVPLLDVAGLAARFQLDAGRFFADYGLALLHGAAAWALAMPALVALAYVGLKPLLRRLVRRTRTL